MFRLGPYPPKILRYVYMNIPKSKPLLVLSIWGKGYLYHPVTSFIKRQLPLCLLGCYLILLYSTWE